MDFQEYIFLNTLPDIDRLYIRSYSGWRMMFKTKIMGTINRTPDSYYKASRAESLEQAISAAIQMANHGADIIDVGGESTRPGAAPVPEDEEMERVIPLIEALQRQVKVPVSIDTMKPAVAAAAVKAGASLINDVSGFIHPEMIDLAVRHQLAICVMHMQGNPRTMQIHPDYEEGIIPFLLKWFEDKIETLMHAGVQSHQIILDPGIGFGKTVADNFKIIHNLPEFKRLGFPILLGLSRKSFLHKTLNKPTEELLPATLAMNTVAIALQVDIIRVHDVKEHRDVVDTMTAYTQCLPFAKKC